MQVKHLYALGRLYDTTPKLIGIAGWAKKKKEGGAYAEVSWALPTMSDRGSRT
jgi:hypothetical protein